MSAHRDRGVRSKTTWKQAALVLALQACAATEQGESPEPGSTGTGQEQEPSSTEEDDSEPLPGASAGTTGAGGELDGVPLGPPPDTTPPVEPQQPGPKLDVRVVSANGTGCPAGSWSAVAEANGAIQVRFDRYTMAAGGDGPSAAVQSCELTLQVETEEDVSFALGALSYEGQAVLSPSASAELTFDSYFQGDPTVHAGDTRGISGPQNGDYLFTYGLAATQTVWSTCGRPRDLNVMLHLRVRAGQEPVRNTLTLAAIRDLQIAVRSCPPEASSDGGSPLDLSDAGVLDAGTGGPGITSVTRR